MRQFLFLLIVVATSSSAFAELRIVSYNIHHGVGMDGKLDLERIAKVLEAEKPDLIALQEVDKNCQRSGNIDQAAWLAKRLGMQHAFGKAIQLGSGEYGNAVLSRFPITSSKVHALPGGPEARIALETVIEIPSGKSTLAFFSLHLDHTGKSTLDQAKALVDLISKMTTPLIIAGDFNAARNGEVMNEIAKIAPLPDPAGWTCPADHPRKEIDFIVPRGFTGKNEAKVVEEPVASDHRPLLLVISASS